MFKYKTTFLFFIISDLSFYGKHIKWLSLLLFLFKVHLISTKTANPLCLTFGIHIYLLEPPFAIFCPWSLGENLLFLVTTIISHTLYITTSSSTKPWPLITCSLVPVYTPTVDGFRVCNHKKSLVYCLSFLCLSCAWQRSFMSWRGNYLTLPSQVVLWQCYVAHGRDDLFLTEKLTCHSHSFCLSRVPISLWGHVLRPPEPFV